jgi:ABC-type bacteriocin/lantibiotic exporter with double-glycine peptidase domain
VRYRPNAPLVLCGISCTFEGGHKIGIVGRTGSGKTTLISALFRLVEPAGGKIIVDGIDISTIGLHDLRSRFGIIPQDPTLFNGTVRFNLDPLSQHSDQEIWEVLLWIFFTSGCFNIKSIYWILHWVNNAYKDHAQSDYKCDFPFPGSWKVPATRVSSRERKWPRLLR